jgi:hypothetical protein
MPGDDDPSKARTAERADARLAGYGFASGFEEFERLT